MTKSIHPTDTTIINDTIIHSWVSSAAFFAGLLGLVVWIFRLAVRDQVKKEILPLATDIASVKIALAVVQADIANISKNTHAIKTTEKAEEATMNEVLDAVQELRKELKKQK